MIERFTPINGDRINYQATVSDPLVYTRPWTIAFALNRQKDELLEVACHEDNQDLQHLKDVRDEARAQSADKLYEVAMGRVRFIGILAALVGLSVVSAAAHHSFSAEYDSNKPLKLTGKVIEMRWSNPHAWIYINVTGKDGKVVKWAWETGGANALYRRGWRKEDLAAGTVLVVDGYQARNGSTTANATSITFQDGRRLFAGSSNPNAPK